ncbi:type II CAAX endopeptidase family protein [Marivirga salinae]|uniref:Type II CAAX endopeptidase family protein n=1 Tax=Marivirga salinarum TaxID=3059078 RepID=A0AA49GCG6_9BACT|nr:type II CAAX endopeptidase family protein [Marivirga sp. BDSF4-3]WKK77757.2 type II CAAX endopeptidase family protein [Marivirga sp. BDSF4-3]
MGLFKKISKVELFLAIACLLVALAFPPIGVLIGFIIVLVYLLVGKDHKEKFKSIGFRSPKDGWIKTVFLCLIYGILIEVSFQIVVNPVIEIITAAEVDLTAYDGIRNNFINYLSVLLIGWVVGGFIEEILFRGYLITRLSKLFQIEKAGNWFAIILTSLVFGFSHLYQGWSGVISTGLISIIFGFIFIQHRKVIWYTILTHGFINTTALTLMWLDYDNISEKLLFN